MSTEATLVNIFSHRAENLEDRQALKVLAGAMDGNEDCLRAVKALADDAGLDFIEVLTVTRQMLDTEAELAAARVDLEKAVLARELCESHLADAGIEKAKAFRGALQNKTVHYEEVVNDATGMTGVLYWVHDERIATGFESAGVQALLGDLAATHG